MIDKILIINSNCYLTCSTTFTSVVFVTPSPLILTQNPFHFNLLKFFVIYFDFTC